MPAPKKIVLATRNPGKVAELRSLLDGVAIEVISAADYPDAPHIEEDEPTLEGNSRKKALALFQHTGIPSLADDTGLEVDALGGAPGVHSARFAGPDANDARNRRKLLYALQGHENRNARFRTVVSYVDEDGVRYFEGVCEGRIEQQERGTGGFGYDPLFTPIGETRTFAELEPDEKNALSHRGRALRAFLAFLKEQS